MTNILQNTIFVFIKTILKIFFIKRTFTFFASFIIVATTIAQQWAGSSTTADTIYRHGMVRMMPDSVGAPFSEWTPSGYKVYRYNNNDWRWQWVSIEWDGIHMGSHIPAPSNSTTIGHGTFSFYTGNPYYDGYQLIYNNQGILSSNGKIITTDSVVAQNLKASNSVRATYGYFSTLQPTNVSVNGATTSSTYKLAVNSGIICEELKVMADVPSSDYVFEKEYELRSLNEVETFVNENKHLPDVPSAKEFKENGYKVGEMDDLLLRKIEELTLYIIDLQKQIEELRNK